MSTLKVDKIDPQTGTALEIGSSGDTMTVPSGATLDISSATLTPPATMPASSGVNLTALNATQLTSGTVPEAALASSVFPAGHVIQMKALDFGSPTVNGGSGAWAAASGTDMTLNRTSGSVVLYCLSGGGGYTGASGRSIFILGRRTSGSSYTGTAVDLGNSTYGNARTAYGGSTPIISSYSVRC